MQPPAVLWPFPLWTAAAVPTAIMGFVWWIARARIARWNRELQRLGPQLRELGLALGSSAFAVGEGKNVMVMDGDRLAVTDLKQRRVVQTFELKDAISLKIYEDRSDRIGFRVVMHGGAQTRKISTWSIAGFGKLFIQFGRAGKAVEYIQG